MVVGSIIATGEERGGGEGGGGKEDIHVLLTEWRRKIKKKKCMQGKKGQGMETNPLHALKAGVSVARCNLHMLHKQHASSPQVPRICKGYR